MLAELTKIAFALSPDRKVIALVIVDDKGNILESKDITRDFLDVALKVFAEPMLLKTIDGVNLAIMKLELTKEEVELIESKGINEFPKSTSEKFLEQVLGKKDKKAEPEIPAKDKN